jgi:hypothetical protein
MLLPTPILDMPPCATTTVCRVSKACGTSSAVPFLSEPYALGGWVMLYSNEVVILSEEWANYIKSEADKRGVSIEEVYRAEKEATERLAHKPILTLDALKLAIESSNPNPRYLEDDEEYPF